MFGGPGIEPTAQARDRGSTGQLAELVSTLSALARDRAIRIKLALRLLSLFAGYRWSRSGVSDVAAESSEAK